MRAPNTLMHLGVLVTHQRLANNQCRLETFNACLGTVDGNRFLFNGRAAAVLRPSQHFWSSLLTE
jgi:hypothetical protein